MILDILPGWAVAILVLLATYAVAAVSRKLMEPKPGAIRGPVFARVAFLLPALLWLVGFGLAWRASGWVVDSVADYAVALSLVIGLIVSQVFGNLSAGLISVLTDLIRVGETVEINGDLFTVTKRTLVSVQGVQPTGTLIDYPWKIILENPVVNWTRVEFARAHSELYICDRSATNEEVMDVVYSVIDGNEKYGILRTESGGDAPIAEEHHAFVRYAADEANARLFHIYFFTRYRADVPGLRYDLNLDIRNALDTAGIAYGQVGHLFWENEFPAEF